MLGVQFLDYAKERASKVYGPFESVQLTYDTLRTVDPDDDEFAGFDEDVWVGPDTLPYSDVVIAPYDSKWPEPTDAR